MRTYRAANLSVLWFLIALNVILFIITLIRPETIYFLGLTPALLSKQPWTIISSMFVHGSFWHIIVNMISLYFLGSFMLRAVGEKSFLAIFFLGGLVGNGLYFLFGPQLIPGVGASGGIFALAGALAIMVPRVPVLLFPIPIPIPLWIAILIFFFILVILPMLIQTRIAWQAHLGGLCLGLVAGLIYKKRRRIYYF